MLVDAEAFPLTDAVQARGLVRRFGPVRALDGLDLSVRVGELYGLIGPNGSGKTTLIRILTGLDRATSGRVCVLDSSPRSVRASIGYMPQEQALYEDLSVFENLEFFAGLHGVRDPRRLREVLDQVDLWDDRDRIVEKLSGGMRRRASLAAALAARPRILFLDEPTVGVDPLLRARLWDDFLAFAHGGGAALITTHHMEEARRCDRVGLLWRGRLLTEGLPQELLDRTGTNSLEDVFLALVGRPES